MAGVGGAITFRSTSPQAASVEINASFRLHQALARIGPQIVETHQSKAGALGRCMARLNFRSNAYRPRLIHIFHCHQFTGYFNSAASRCLRLPARARLYFLRSSLTGGRS